jgi:2-oxoglutarate/2-oxoacid ferredoxin oxidoreductase subunit alpha
LENKNAKKVLTDASMLITEACVQTGADAFIGYPITPSNRFYAYGTKRYPLFLAGPDEITVLQWMAGLSAAGKFPVTATAFPGFALMLESFNMTFMMELPMLLILTQRLGPSTGSATTGAQGDLSLLHGSISGGFPVPVLCPSNFKDAWELTNECIKISVNFRTPVVLLTSKEMVMTQKSFDLSELKEIDRIDKSSNEIELPYKPYRADDNLIPPFLPVGNNEHQVRINASTHDNEGLIRKGNPESLANTKRLKEKFEKRMDAITFYELDEDLNSKDLIVTYGISADAARDAVLNIRKKGRRISLLVVKTLLPVSKKIIEIIDSYKNVTFVEENISGQYKNIIYGAASRKNVQSVNKIGSMISPSEIEKELAL